jgi:hydroxyethylthiazole kinase
MTKKINAHLIKIKRTKPIIFNINQYYSLDLVVSGLRSIGALPITSNAEQEIEELLKLCNAVVVNLGKLDIEFIKLIHRICQTANEQKKPIILDPVGAGASRFRTETAINIIKNHQISIVRGYESEISSLLNDQLITIDTESTTNELACKNAKLLSEKYKMAVVLSGRINTIIDSDKVESFNFDSELLSKIAGISSLLSALLGAFHSVEEDRFIAATSAVKYYATCAGIAKNRANGPGSIRTLLIDELYINSHKIVNE